MLAEKSEYLRQWRKNNPGYEKTRWPKRKPKVAEYRARPEVRARTNDKQNARRAELPAEKREALNAGMRAWRKLNPNYDKMNRPHRGRDAGPAARIIRNLRRRIHHVIADGYRSAHTKELLGCSTDQFLGHIEINFQEGMTWDNYGPVWHVDHIKPCASFDMKNPAQQRACFHWKNHQPLFAQENLSKGAKLITR